MREHTENIWDVSRRLEDVPAWVRMLACCGTCPKKVELDRAALIKRFGPKTRLVRLEMHLKCSRCGNRIGTWIELQSHPR